jgi:two-component sensor histidine kinase
MRTEERLKTSLREKELLLREVHHRVKNNMQIISSLLKYQSDTRPDGNPREIFRESQDRINAISMIHELLYQSEDLASIDFRRYVTSLASSLYRSRGVSMKRVNLDVDVSKLSVGVDTAVPCGLIINELVSNSLQHAFPDGGDGEIGIALDSHDGDECELTVCDNGAGIPDALNFRESGTLGLRLVVNLVEHQLRGMIELSRAEGTEFRIHFKEPKYKNRM